MKTTRGKAAPLEKSLSARFRARLLQKFPDAFVYKIPDTFGLGGQRPFDCIAIIREHTFVFEFKRGGIRKATPYQQFNMSLAANNGAHARLVNEENWYEILDYVDKLVTGGY